jgi:hypothetical protein
MGPTVEAMSIASLYHAAWSLGLYHYMLRVVQDVFTTTMISQVN